MSSHATAATGVEREQRKRRAIAISIGAATVLTAIKLVVAIVTGSVAILSETINSLTDIVAAVIAMLALRRASSPPDSRHRYGHDKLENISAVIEGIIILGAITYVIVEAVMRLVQGGHEVDQPMLAAFVMVASSVINLGVASYLSRVGRETESVARPSRSRCRLTPTT